MTKLKTSGSWKPGQSGNPNGRPKGSRHKLSEAFLKALVETFEEGGEDSLRDLLKKQPAQYNRLIASLMPKLMELSGPDGEEIPLSGTLKIVRDIAAESDS